MKDAPEINGWSPPLAYDVQTDERRLATQLDIDMYQCTANALGRMKTEMDKIWVQYRAEIESIKARHDGLQ